MCSCLDGSALKAMSTWGLSHRPLFGFKSYRVRRLGWEKNKTKKLLPLSFLSRPVSQHAVLWDLVPLSLTVSPGTWLLWRRRKKNFCFSKASLIAHLLFDKHKQGEQIPVHKNNWYTKKKRIFGDIWGQLDLSCNFMALKNLEWLLAGLLKFHEHFWKEVHQIEGN